MPNAMQSACLAHSRTQCADCFDSAIHVRTYVLTTVVSVGTDPARSVTRTSEEPDLARFDAAARGLSAPHLRHPVIRTGARRPIPWPVRLAVYLRDGNRCQLCGQWVRHGGSANLDHIVPWSAGGPDITANLRLLCVPCNEARSNYDHGASGKRVLPATWWCLDCWTQDAPRSWVSRMPWRELIDPLEPDDPTVLAYCAACDGNAHTSVWL